MIKLPDGSELKAVKDKDGVTQLYDIYVNKAWIGSRRTIDQCKMAITCHKQNGPTTTPTF